jgi:hypothetical protein
VVGHMDERQESRSHLRPRPRSRRDSASGRGSGHWIRTAFAPRAKPVRPEREMIPPPRPGPHWSPTPASRPRPASWEATDCRRVTHRDLAAPCRRPRHPTRPDRETIAVSPTSDRRSHLRSRLAAVLVALGVSGCISSGGYPPPPPGYVGEIPARAERACDARARRARLDVRSFHGWRRAGRYHWDTMMTVRDLRSGRTFQRGCRYDDRRDRASLFRP